MLSWDMASSVFNTVLLLATFVVRRVLTRALPPGRQRRTTALLTASYVFFAASTGVAAAYQLLDPLLLDLTGWANCAQLAAMLLTLTASMLVAAWSTRVAAVAERVPWIVGLVAAVSMVVIYALTDLSTIAALPLARHQSPWIMPFTLTYRTGGIVEACLVISIGLTTLNGKGKRTPVGCDTSARTAIILLVLYGFLSLSYSLGMILHHLLARKSLSWLYWFSYTFATTGYVVCLSVAGLLAARQLQQHRDEISR
ncbi:hypothetical protein [Mycobacteroides abscessus]|uniref:hypothetical protein n=1 Tax=Mycobacteroides abscessus TaxID=36809 RepID=UPI000C26241F|nr:hypothetical protein [Mycobacteroides abscessus]MBE5460511.1 hypothetical protein [Mycobacteroides abscessus]QOF41287.1 hypothetical protein E3G69_000302 [Mycobacteroides abscessus]QOF45984.1 hypothetical protein E3G70_000299 [Mycobacteroides abscessus]